MYNRTLKNKDAEFDEKHVLDASNQLPMTILDDFQKKNGVFGVYNQELRERRKEFSAKKG